jgi:hypothetical protein
MLYCNVFPEGDALLEREPQGETAIPVRLPDADERAVAELLECVEMSATLAKLFLLGATVCSRTADEIPF